MRLGVPHIRSILAACFVLVAMWVALCVSMGCVALYQNRVLLLLTGPSASVKTYLEAQQQLALAAPAADGSNPNIDVAAAQRSRALAVVALHAQPVSAPLLRTLALAGGMLGDTDLADVAMMTAARASRRDEPTQFYMLQRSFERNELAAGTAYFDALLRLDSPARAMIFKLTVPLMENGQLLDAITKRMAIKPTWRDAFLYEVSTTARPATALATLRRLRAIGSPPTSEELAPYFARMATQPDVPSTYRDWIDFFKIDSKVSPLVRDGGFEGQTGVLPFAWLLTSEDAINATIAKRDDGKGKALHAEMYTVAAKPVARQLLVLDPGRYIISGKYLAEAGSWAAVEWTLTCNDPSGQVFGHIPMPQGTSDHWQQSQAEFSVPQGCLSQWLILTSATQTDIVDRSLWIDEISIAPVRTES